MSRKKIKLPTADESVTMPKEIEDIIKETSIEPKMPDDVQTMIDSGLTNKEILFGILDINEKSYKDFLEANRDNGMEDFLSLVIAAKQF